MAEKKEKNPGLWDKLVQISCYLLIWTLHILTRNAEKRFHTWPEFMHEHAHNKSNKEWGFSGVNPNKNITGMEKTTAKACLVLEWLTFSYLVLYLFPSLSLPLMLLKIIFSLIWVYICFCVYKTQMKILIESAKFAWWQECCY